MATSTCSGDYDNGASWGPIVYTDNCYTGKVISMLLYLLVNINI